MSNVYVNDVYYNILESKHRFVINCGGRDSGKSYFAGGQLIPIKMQQEKYFRGLAVRKTYASLKDSVFQEVQDGITEMGLGNSFKCIKSPLEVRHKTSGNKLIFRGLDSPLNIKSLKGISFVMVEEAEELTKKEFMDLLILLRAGENPQLLLNFNPLDEDHFTNKDFFETVPKRVIETFEDGEKKVWETSIKAEINGEEIEILGLVVRSTYRDNLFIDPVRKAVIESLKYSDPFLYEVYAKGKFGKKGGRILYNVEEVDFDSKGWEFNNFDNKGYSQDFGFNHANAILSVAEKDDCLYVFDEIYEHEKDIDEIFQIVEERQLQKRLRMVCDSAEPDKIQTIKKKGYKAFGVEKYQGSVKAQIDWLKRKKKIYINSKCKWTLKESKSWQWRQNKEGRFLDDPLEVFDDAMAALRYSKDLFDNKKTGKAVKNVFG